MLAGRVDKCWTCKPRLGSGKIPARWGSASRRIARWAPSTDAGCVHCADPAAFDAGAKSGSFWVSFKPTKTKEALAKTAIMGFDGQQCQPDLLVHRAISGQAA